MRPASCINPEKKLSRPLSRSGGFTLIELLVVVIIIAILTSMVLMVTNLARGQAKQLQCQSNLRQMGVAILAYAADNNNLIPPGQAPAPDRDIYQLKGWGMYYFFVESYLSLSEGSAVHWCPGGIYTLAEMRTFGDWQYAACYGMNGRALPDSDWWNVRLAKVPSPDRSIMMTDRWGAGGSGGGPDWSAGVEAPMWAGDPVSGPRRGGIGAYAPRASHPANTSTDSSKYRLSTLFYSGRAEALRWQDSYMQGDSWFAKWASVPNQWLARY